MHDWLGEAALYEVYPQSFYDSNGDGIGDIKGITAKLDYIRSLGCNGIWLNPCFDSPFKDAGYDVRDYKKIASRYGSNKDMAELFNQAHGRGIRVLLDLVPGHTSEEHEWFKRSGSAQVNEYSGRYIWTDFCFQGIEGHPYIGGEAQRSGTYLPNFFKSQPALNYGWLHPDEIWQSRIDSPEAVATREAIEDVMRYWLDMGCDGFRVDMAASLVKGDDELHSGTTMVWLEIRKMLDREYPQAVMISEWNDPTQAMRAGFDADLCLNDYENGYGVMTRDYQNHAGRDIRGSGYFSGSGDEEAALSMEDHSFFKADADGDIEPFIRWFEGHYERTKESGYISITTGSHDMVRARFNLDPSELALYYAFVLTLPGAPILYYGDEIGMRYLSLENKEGGYFRTGSRTPMQWAQTTNLGFSEAESRKLYLPVDRVDASPTVEGQEGDPHSLLNTVRRLIHLRRSLEDLQGNATFATIWSQPKSPAYVYRRGELTLAINTSTKSMRVPVVGPGGEPVFTIGRGEQKGGVLELGAQSFVIFK